MGTQNKVIKIMFKEAHALLWSYFWKEHKANFYSPQKVSRALTINNRNNLTLINWNIVL